MQPETLYLYTSTRADSCSVERCSFRDLVFSSLVSVKRASFCTAHARGRPSTRWTYGNISSVVKLKAESAV